MGAIAKNTATTPSAGVGRPDTVRADGRPESLPSLIPSLVSWALIGLWAVTIVTTYARLPAEELYNVSNTGLIGGLSRMLVFLGYPSALAAILVLGFVWARVRRSQAVTQRSRRAFGVLTVIAVLLCASVGIPGVVDPDNLDAKALNVVAAVGVVLAAGLTAWAAWRTGVGLARRFVKSDSLRAAFAVVLLVVAIPWAGALMGFYVTETPVLGDLFLSGELRTQPGDPDPRPAVHLGDHEGFDGVLLVLIVLLLGRELHRIRASALRTVLVFGSSLALVYGLAVVLKDFWLEQIVKRGWTDFEITGVLEPGASLGWAGILVATVLIAAALERRLRRSDEARLMRSVT